jgi:hypothetical protein
VKAAVSIDDGGMVRAVGLRRRDQGENILRFGNAEAQSTTMSSKPQGVHIAIR